MVTSVMFTLGALGGTLTGDPCSLFRVIGVVPGYIKGYTRPI